jgi:hypothetical protein
VDRQPSGSKACRARSCLHPSDGATQSALLARIDAAREELVTTIRMEQSNVFFEQVRQQSSRKRLVTW